MKSLKILLLALLVCSCNSKSSAQENIRIYTFKKGEILDVLLIDQKPETDSLFQDYVKVAFPVAIEMSYKNLPGFPIVETTQGNIQPKGIGFGKWGSKRLREEFLAQIETKVPDFHSRRRAIWSYFSITYYEMPRDITFKVNRDKYNVVTAYWKKEGPGFKEFIKAFKETSRTYGGKAVLELENGTSPFGYFYQPDYLVITEWDSKQAFDSFYQKNLEMASNGLGQVHQFAIK